MKKKCTVFNVKRPFTKGMAFLLALVCIFQLCLPIEAMAAQTSLGTDEDLASELENEDESSICETGEISEENSIDEELINVEEDLTGNQIIDGFTCSDDGKTLIGCPEGATGECKIPNTIEVIGEYAFSKSKYSSIVISNSVKLINPKAFLKMGWDESKDSETDYVDIDFTETNEDFLKNFLDEYKAGNYFASYSDYNMYYATVNGQSSDRVRFLLNWNSGANKLLAKSYQVSSEYREGTFPTTFTDMNVYSFSAVGPCVYIDMYGKEYSHNEFEEGWNKTLFYEVTSAMNETTGELIEGVSVGYNTVVFPVGSCEAGDTVHVTIDSMYTDPTDFHVTFNENLTAEADVYYIWNGDVKPINQNVESKQYYIFDNEGNYVAKTDFKFFYMGGSSKDTKVVLESGEYQFLEVEPKSSSYSFSGTKLSDFNEDDAIASTIVPVTVSNYCSSYVDFASGKSFKQIELIDGSYSITSNSMNTANELSVQYKTNLTDNDLEGQYVKVSLSNGFHYIEGSARINGDPVDEVTTKGGYVYIPANKAEGTITFRAYTESLSNTFDSTAYILNTFGEGDNPKEVVTEIGRIVLSGSSKHMLTINADKRTENPLVTVSGTSILKNYEVRICEGNEVLATATSDSNYNWETTVELSNDLAITKHTIYAEVVSDYGKCRSDAINVYVHNPDAPNYVDVVIQEVTLGYHNKDYTLLKNGDERKPTIIYAPWYDYSNFTLDLDAPNIASVYVAGYRGSNLVSAELQKTQDNIWMTQSLFLQNEVGAKGILLPDCSLTQYDGDIDDLKQNPVEDFRVYCKIKGSDTIYEIGTFYPCYIIDPSGFVYEAVESNRLQGVTVTAYKADDVNGNNKIQWNATDYNQENPLVTDREGRFAWDVPRGYWQVKAEKEGYIQATSEWLQVPPPQLDVNIDMVSTQAPTVEFVELTKDYALVHFSQYMLVSSITTDKFSLSSSAGRVTISSVEAVQSEDAMARDYILHFASSLDEKQLYSLRVTGGTSYNSETLGEVTLSDLRIVAAVTELNADEITSFVKDSVFNLAVTTNSDAGVRQLTCTAEDPNTVEVVSCGVIVGGKGSIQLMGKAAGTTLLTLGVEDSTIQKTITIIVAANGAIASKLQEENGTNEPGEEPTSMETINNGLKIENIGECVYTGNVVKPSFTVKFLNKVLKEGTDYTVTYKNNINVAEVTGSGINKDYNSKKPSIIITGKGDYAGSFKTNFAIKSKELPSDISTDNTLSAVYKDTIASSKKNQSPTVTLMYNGKKVASSNYTLTYCKRGGVEAANIAKNDSGEFDIVLKGKGNFSGTLYLPITVLAKAVVPFNKVKVTVPASVGYTGSKLNLSTIGITAVYNKTPLNYTTKGSSEDGYYAEAVNDIAVGTAKVTFIGTGCYEGSVTKSVKIVGANFANAVISLDSTQKSVVYDGNVKSLELTEKVTYKVTNESESAYFASHDYMNANAADGTIDKNDYVVLTASDYKCTLIKGGTNAGKATFMVTGQGFFSGSRNVTITITQAELTENMFNAIPDQKYVKGGVKPVITGSMDSSHPLQAKDFRVSYSNYTKVTKDGKLATATVKGCGNFKGKVVLTYSIIPTDMMNIMVQAEDVVATSKLPYATKITVKDIDGKNLTAGTDYEKAVKYYLHDETNDSWNEITNENKNSYAASLVAGAKMKVVVRGIGNYAGNDQTSLKNEKEVEYYLVSALMNKATIKISDQVFDGKQVTLTQDAFTKATIKVGNKTKNLELGKDFIVMDDASNGYVKKGTYKVVLVGTHTADENGTVYGGSKVVNVKVVSAKFYWNDLFKNIQSFFH